MNPQHRQTVRMTAGQAIIRYLSRQDSEADGKACGLLVVDGAAAATRLAEGWTFVAIGSDTTLLATAVTSNLARARAWTGTKGKKEHA